MYKFKINFSGLIGCVPHVNDKEVMLLMVDGRYPHRATDGEELFPHFPFIHYSLSDIEPGSARQPELTGRGYGLNFLSLEDLRIGTQQGSPLEYEYTKGYPKQEPDHYGGNSYKNDRMYSLGSRDLCWILPIHKVVGEDAALDDLKVADECLAKTYQVTEKGNRVVARLWLRTGRFYVDDFHTKSAGGESLNTICRFPYKKNGATKHYEQVVGTSSIYELDGGNILRISSTSFKLPNGATAGKFPDLVFQDPGVLGRDVIINIWNAPFKDVLDLLGGKHDWASPQRDRSFRSYFRLCKRPPQELPILEKKEYPVAKVQTAYALNKKDVGCPKCLFQKADFPVTLAKDSSSTQYVKSDPTPAAPPPST